MPGAYTGERWKRARKAALARDKVCQDCGSSENLHVHHITPVKDFEVEEDAHDINNLVVLCASCHRKWEGKDARPNLLDSGTGLSLSRLVHHLSKESIEQQMDAPGPWILYERFIESNLTDRYHCDFCFSSLDTTRESTEHCSSCGRSAKLWKAYNSPPSSEGMHDRVNRLYTALKQHGIPADKDMMHDVAEYLWNKDEYYGRIQDVTRVVARQGIRYGHDETAVDVDYDPICPIPKPIPQ